MKYKLRVYIFNFAKSYYTYDQIFISGFFTTF